jgi:hypothetical protein
MKTYLIAIAAWLLPICIAAQAEKSPDDQKASFQSLAQGGMLTGSSSVAGQVQTVHGVNYRGYFIGLGAGIDFYFQRSVPVFAELQKELRKSAYTPFVYAEAGHHFIWTKEPEEFAFESDHKGGLFYDLGLGYKFPVAKKLQLFFSGGYSLKRFSKVVNTMPWSSVWPPPPQSFQKYEYDLRRISIKTGLSF